MMLNSFKKFFRRQLRKTGYDFHRTDMTFQKFAMKQALERVVHHTPPIQTMIDIGASTGSWTMQARPFFPQAQFVLIEANPVHEPALKEFTQQNPYASYQLAAAGNQMGETYFDARDPLGGVAIQEAHDGYTLLPMITLDSLIADGSLPAPYAIKFDTHGFELPILEGAQDMLSQTELIIMECYNYEINSALLHFEMANHMRDLGFRVVDMADATLRPKDGTLWQFDLFFIRETNPIFKDLSFN